MSAISAAAMRNREPIREKLASHLRRGTVLEIASGSGVHAEYFAQHFSDCRWQPSDFDAHIVANLRALTKSANIASPLQLDVLDASTWPERQYDAVYNANMLHISPPATLTGLMRLAQQVLVSAGLLFIYGPFIEADVSTAPSNLDFDHFLKQQNPDYGIRHLTEVVAAAEAVGLQLIARDSMPANNLFLTFRLSR